MNRRADERRSGTSRPWFRHSRSLVRTVCFLTVGMIVAAMCPGLNDVVSADVGATLTKQALDPAGNPIAERCFRVTGRHDQVGSQLREHDWHPGHSVVTDPIGAGQTFVPGSLQTPPTWSKEYSADGTTFGTTDLGHGHHCGALPG